MKRIDCMDIPFIVRCLVDLHEESPVYSKIKPDPIFVGDQLRALFNTGAMQGCIEPEKGFMFGFICANWYDPEVQGHEQILYVKKQYRGRTVALELIREFELICYDAGARKLSVGSSTGIADARTEFMYERLGYIRNGHVLVKDLSYVRS